MPHFVATGPKSAAELMSGGGSGVDWCWRAAEQASLSVQAKLVRIGAGEQHPPTHESPAGANSARLFWPMAVKCGTLRGLEERRKCSEIAETSWVLFLRVVL